MSERTQQLYELCQRAEKKGRIVIIGHDRADVDSAAACVLMNRLLERWEIASHIVLHEPDKQSRRVMARFDVDVSALEGETKDTDFLILVDHHQSAHPGSVLACIDHHPTEYPPEFPYVQIEDCGACAVMVLPGLWNKYIFKSS